MAIDTGSQGGFPEKPAQTSEEETTGTTTGTTGTTTTETTTGTTTGAGHPPSAGE
jgi:hypothetical protein